MGIKGLYKFLKEYPDLINYKTITNFNNKKIAIDTSIVLYQVVIAIRNTGTDLKNKEGKITSHILGLFNKTCTLLKRNIIPIYVFDGKPPLLKKDVISNRKLNRLKAEKLMRMAKTEEERIKYFKRCVHITKEQINESKELLELMGIPFINSIEEADTQCAYLCKNNLVYGVLTEDMDILTFGSKKILRNLSSYKNEPLELDLDNILNKLEFTMDNFIDFCILLGCDYSSGLTDIKSNVIYKYFSETKNIEETIKLLKKNNYQVNNFDYKEAKQYFLKNHDIVQKNENDLVLKEPKIKDLENLLVNKYGLLKNKIQNKLKFLEHNYTIESNDIDEYTLNI